MRRGKNQAHTVIKEMKLRPKIDPHDYETKKGHVVRFLKAGDKVKVTIMFRGREQSRPELGFRLLQRLAADVAELGFVESAPKQDGRNMIMVLGPHKKKAEAQRRSRPTQARHRGRCPSRRVTEAAAAAGRARTSRRAPGAAADAVPTRAARVDPACSLSDPAGCTVARHAPSDQHDDSDGDDGAMPKNKTHSGTKKRFKVTGTGKLHAPRRQAPHARAQVQPSAPGASTATNGSPGGRQAHQAAAGH